MLPVMITNIHHAFREIKHFDWNQWEGDFSLKARQSLREVLETRMHSSID